MQKIEHVGIAVKELAVSVLSFRKAIEHPLL